MNETKRIAVFFVLSAAVMFGWSHFFPNKPATPAISSVADVKASNSNTSVESKDVLTKQAESSEAVAKVNSVELLSGKNTIRVFNDFSFELVSSSESKFSTDNFFKNTSKKIYFAQESFLAELVAEPNKVILINPQTKANILTVEVGDNDSFNFKSESGFQTNFVLKNTVAEEKSDIKRSFIYLSKELNSVVAGDEKNDEQEIRWFGLDYNHHLLALVLDNKSSSKIEVLAGGLVKLKPASQVKSFSLFYTQKDYDHLKVLGSNLELAIDYGVLSFIALPMLRVLQFFYNFIPNYGVSIILLTIFMRLLTFPLQWKSFKSMKKMQDIQPEIQKLKDRFKDDPQALNRETMNLFKRSGANPIGGCLPLLLQMPIFFAMYKVLQNSSELVHSPFILWLTDLSTKDPLYVLPILLSIVMFLQQKLTPTTVADPAQKKILLFMPLIFGFFMKDLPSGLCLYIIISTVVGIFQQMIVYKFIK